MCKSEKDNHHSRYLTKGVVHNRGTVGKIFNKKKGRREADGLVASAAPHPVEYRYKKQDGRIIIINLSFFFFLILNK